ncbi:MAG: cardiolipin synthase [Lachnospiraceae bacterium]|nr:cardiolipin synthase [Lachnospiraceae bacterium]
MKLFLRYGKSFIRFLTIAMLIILQIGLMFVLAYFLKNNAVFVYLAIEILSLLILIPLMADSRNETYKLYWMSVILTLPIVGHIMYDLWGKDKANKMEHLRIQKIVDKANQFQHFDKELIVKLHKEDPEKWKIANYLYRVGYPLYAHTKLTYFQLGELAFDDMEKEFELAEKYIFMSFFTIADGIIFQKICNIVEKKVQQGVEVFVLYDDAGSVFQIADDTIEQLQKVGVNIIRFNPVEKSYHRLFLNYRNHQKIVVIDGKVGYTGGINASDRYANINSPYGHWKDIALKLQGDGVWSMALIFLGMWEASGKVVDYSKYKVENYFTSGGFCQPFADGPSNNPENEAVDIYRHMIQEANKEVFITTPYLILDDTVRNTLCLAAKSGIDVRIITPGIPDKKKAKLLTEFNYGTLLKSGVRIYEYEKGFMHGKMILNEFSVVVGTINMDFRSFFLHYESAVWTTQEDTIKEIRADFMSTLDSCREINYLDWKNRPLKTKIKQYLLLVFKCQF